MKSGNLLKLTLTVFLVQLITLMKSLKNDDLLQFNVSFKSSR